MIKIHLTKTLIWSFLHLIKNHFFLFNNQSELLLLDSDDEYRFLLLFSKDLDLSLLRYYFSSWSRFLCLSFLCFFYFFSYELSRWRCLCYLSFFFFYFLSFFYFLCFFYFFYLYFFSYFYKGWKSSKASSLWGLSIVADGLDLISTFALSKPIPIASGAIGSS